jgi:hypothetical protein
MTDYSFLEKIPEIFFEGEKPFFSWCMEDTFYQKWSIDKMIIFAIQAQKDGFKPIVEKPLLIKGDLYDGPHPDFEDAFFWHKFIETAFCPEEELPLYLNSDLEMVRRIAIERLKCLTDPNTTIS